MKTIFMILTIVVAMTIGTVDAVETISEDAKALAIMTIKGYENVVDASIRQQGSQIKLFLLVDYGTSEPYALRMGDRFIRMLKSYGPDASPGHRIGPGMYDYYIGVAMPSRTILGNGVKLGSSHDLKWLSRSNHLVNRSARSDTPFF